MVVAARRLIVGLVSAGLLSGSAVAQEYVAKGACRDGAAQGVYELRDGQGRLRVLGAFNHGQRTGSFLFWTGNGVRVAHIPYDEGAINGTLSLWYSDPVGNEPPRKLEASYRANRLDGEKRSWHRNGRLRMRARYVAGELRSAQAWDQTGRRLDDAAAVALATRDLAEDDEYFASLDSMVKAHPPTCDNDPAPVQRAGYDIRLARYA
ncbi:MAG TPA: hypothetical protein VMV45_15705 [Casimicrobiaceae bacterium]|nr:hypothetical protein [Casimicrobiaceae bacterium]